MAAPRGLTTTTKSLELTPIYTLKFFFMSQDYFSKVLVSYLCLKTNKQTKEISPENMVLQIPLRSHKVGQGFQEAVNSTCSHTLSPMAQGNLWVPIQALWASGSQPQLYRALCASPALPYSERTEGVRVLDPWLHQMGLHSCTHPGK